AWAGIGGAAAWRGVGTAALIAHLGSETTRAVFVEQMPQRAHRQTQQLSSHRLVASGASQRFENVCLLELVEVGREVDSFFRKLHRFRDPIGIVVCDLLGQTLGLDRSGSFECHRSLDRVFKLTYVAGPRVTFE